MSSYHGAQSISPDEDDFMDIDYASTAHLQATSTRRRHSATSHSVANTHVLFQPITTTGSPGSANSKATLDPYAPNCVSPSDNGLLYQTGPLSGTSPTATVSAPGSHREGCALSSSYELSRTPSGEFAMIPLVAPNRTVAPSNCHCTMRHAANCSIARLSATASGSHCNTTAQSTSGQNPSQSNPLHSTLSPYLVQWHEGANPGSSVPKGVDLKTTKSMSRHEMLEISILLPNGCFFPINIYDDSTLKDIKEELWSKYSSLIRDLEDEGKGGYRRRTRINELKRISENQLPPPREKRDEENESTHVLMEALEKRVLREKEKASSGTLSFPFKLPKSTSLNLSQLKFWRDTAHEKMVASELKAIPKDDSRKGESQPTTAPPAQSFVRSQSVRKKVGNFMSKIRRSSSFRATSANSTDFSSLRAIRGGSETPTLPSSSSSMISGSQITTESTLTSQASSMAPRNNDSNNDGLESLTSESTSTTSKSTLLIETTASMVLADFETEIKPEVLFKTSGQSKLAALAREDPADYVFSGITRGAKVEEFYNESLRFIELDIFMPMLKLIEIDGNKKEKILNGVISQIIGRPMSFLEQAEKVKEFNAFRANLHSTMLATVQERETFSVDERIFYEFPPELDDIECMQLSTKQIATDLERFIDKHAHNGSLESVASNESLESLEEDDSLPLGAETNSKLTERRHEKAPGPRKVSLVEPALLQALPEEEGLGEAKADEEKPVYTEVIALKSKAARLTDRKTTNYQEIASKQLLQAAGKNCILKGKKKHQLTKKKSTKKSNTKAARGTSESTEPIPLPSQILEKRNQKFKEMVKEEKGQRRQDSKVEPEPGYEDLFEVNFERRSSYSSSTSNSRYLEINIWTSLVTFLYGGAHGNIAGAGFEDLVFLFDQISTAQTTATQAGTGKNTDSSSNQIKESDNNSTEKKSKKAGFLFRNLFRKSTLNVIEEVTPSGKGSNSPSSSSLSSIPEKPSTSQKKSGESQLLETNGRVNSQREPSSRGVSGKQRTSSVVASKASHNSTVTALDIQAKAFDMRPHLLPQSHTVRCLPESLYPCDLIERLLHRYLNWLKKWLADNIARASEKVEASTATPPTTTSLSTSSSASSFADTASASVSNTLGLGKTLTKLLNPKGKNLEPIEFGYVEMFLDPAGSTTITDTKGDSDSTSQHSSADQESSGVSGKGATSATDSPTLTPREESARLVAVLNKLEDSLALFEPSRYLLKVCGYEQYLVGEYVLTSFEYIRNCLSKGRTPQLMLISKIAIIEKIPNYMYVTPSFLRRLELHSTHYQLPISSIYHEFPFTVQAKMRLIAGRTDSAASPWVTYGTRAKESTRRTSLPYQTLAGQGQVEKTPPSEVSDEEPALTGEGHTNYAVICAKRTRARRTHRRRTKSSGTDSLHSTSKISNLYSEGSLEPSDGKAGESTKSQLSLDSASPTGAQLAPSQTVFATIGGDDVQTLDSWIEDGFSRRSLLSLWKLQTVFRVRISAAQYVNVKDVDRIYVQAGVFHGAEPLCELQKTKQIDPLNPKWDEMLEFTDLCMQDIPLSARLSVAMCVVINRRRPVEEYATSWVNLQLFDYRHCVLSGRVSLILWPMPKGFEGFLNPHGVTGSNPNRITSPRLIIEFDSFPKPVAYPSRSAILDYARVINKKEFAQRGPHIRESIARIREVTPLSNEESPATKGQSLHQTMTRGEMADFMRKAMSRLDPFAELSEQEKEFFWRERHLIKSTLPDALPKVLESVKWNSREETCQMYALLEEWPAISADTAIALLGSRYIDIFVREFAVKHLDQRLTDGLLANYVIQLIQLLRNEPFFDNALARLLLRRSLLSRRFGHQFFWTLKSQIDDKAVAHRWGVMLEMYCRGLSQATLRTTLAQVEALDELERIGNTTAHESDQREAMLRLFQRRDIQSKVTKFFNPLNIAVPLNELLTDKLRIMDSAKKPLWLEWSNPDPYAKYNSNDISAVIFKTGDDLRQDILTLQVIRIMDLIWRREGLDLKMLPYNCLATGDNVGLIEVVKRSKTVMGIQRSGGRMAALQVDNTKLHKWIKEHNPETYEYAVDNFTRSCAGYCVATFILGIGDRNPDNIMVNEDGQIFHIDFGHFLGHFKKKFGINRERVPFVLTYDFLQVITKGSENPLETKEFEQFQRLCYEAYLALHDNAHLLISLFVMMLGTGIPELQTLEDVQYLRRTLQVDKSRQEALQYFETQLDEAHGGAWSTKLDWFFHSVKHA